MAASKLSVAACNGERCSVRFAATSSGLGPHAWFVLRIGDDVDTIAINGAGGRDVSTLALLSALRAVLPAAQQTIVRWVTGCSSCTALNMLKLVHKHSRQPPFNMMSFRPDQQYALHVPLNLLEKGSVALVSAFGALLE